MVIWQADCYRRPLQSEQGEPLWELLLCDRTFDFTFGTFCPQSQVSTDWVTTQLQAAIAKAGATPEQIEVFRPQTLNLLEVACQPLGVTVVPERAPKALQQWLVQRASWYATQPNATGEAYQPLAVDQPPPTPLPENLWGDQWRFAALKAADFESFLYEPIPICSLPPDRLPLQLGLPSTALLPGVVIDAGRLSLRLAQWIAAEHPVRLRYTPGSPDGLLLDAGLVNRWVLTTFEDAEVAAAGRTFEQRKQQAQGLHFLLVRPDDVGTTFTGLWLLRDAS